MKLESASSTHIGRRANNEDNACHEPELGLFGVADGVGGYEGGEIASQLAVETLAEFVRRNAADDDVTWPYKIDPHYSFDENLLRIGIQLANDRIVARKKGILRQMGSTVAMIRLVDHRAVLAHVGDSRVYRLRNGSLTQLTVDHSLYNEMKAAGTKDMPPRHLWNYSNVITRALGMGECSADLQTERLEEGDTFVLCTDGLTEPVSDELIAEIVGNASAKEACDKLVQTAYDQGGKDNITVVVARVDQL